MISLTVCLQTPALRGTTRRLLTSKELKERLLDLAQSDAEEKDPDFRVNIPEMLYDYSLLDEIPIGSRRSFCGRLFTTLKNLFICGSCSRPCTRVHKWINETSARQAVVIVTVCLVSAAGLYGTLKGTEYGLAKALAWLVQEVELIFEKWVNETPALQLVFGDADVPGVQLGPEFDGDIKRLQECKSSIDMSNIFKFASQKVEKFLTERPELLECVKGKVADHYQKLMKKLGDLTVMQLGQLLRD